MNKTVTANISGIVFHIEAQAYEKLHKYLTTIRNYFHDSDGKDEIMADIESRIAELFRESLSNGRDVITQAEVDRVVEIMGEPEQYMDDSEEHFSSTHTSDYNAPAYKSKKLFRDPDDKILGGVCSGLGHYFGIDRIWLRAAFIIAVILGFGAGIIVYLILWAIIPKAISTSDKLEMKGEPINVENIGNSIKDEFSNFKKKVNPQAENYGKKAGNALHRAFDLIGKFLLFLMKFLVKAFAAILVIAALSGLIGILAVLVGAPADFNINGENFDGYWNQEFAEIFFSSGAMYTFGYLGMVLVLLIPILALLYGGLKILFNIPSSNKAVGFSAIALWVVGIILVSITAASTANQYKNRQTFTEQIELLELTGDTLNLASLEEHYSSGIFDSHEIFIEDGSIYTDNISVDVIESKTDQVYLVLNRAARGSNRKEAGKRAENINFSYEMQENTLAISRYIDFPQTDRFRTQEIEISIALPAGKAIYLEKSSTDIIYDIKNVTNTYDGRMIGHTWEMTPMGLACTDCSWITYGEEEENKENEDEDENEE